MLITFYKLSEDPVSTTCLNSRPGVGNFREVQICLNVGKVKAHQAQRPVRASSQQNVVWEGAFHVGFLHCKEHCLCDLLQVAIHC